jgi:hypothetical protein
MAVIDVEGPGELLGETAELKRTPPIAVERPEIDDAGQELLTDKKENAWTISRRFKKDILSFLKQAAADASVEESAATAPQEQQRNAPICNLAFELGAHVGLTTGFFL